MLKDGFSNSCILLSRSTTTHLDGMHRQITGMCLKVGSQSTRTGQCDFFSKKVRQSDAFS